MGFGMRVYHALLNLSPPRYRAGFGADVMEMIGERRAELGGSPAYRIMAFWAFEYADLSATAVREWMQGAPSALGSGPRPPRRGNRWWQDLWHDLRYAGRSLRTNPGFSTVVVLTLALGLGVNAAIFTVVDGVVLRPLPYDRPDQLMRIVGTDIERGEQPSFTPGDFEAYRAETATFHGIEAYEGGSFVFSGPDREPTRVTFGTATYGLFDLLGIAPILGRGFIPEDNYREAKVLVLNHGFWMRALGGDADILGRTLTLDDEPWEIVGVMPPGFSFPYDDEMGGWIPQPQRPPSSAAASTASRDWANLYLLGRLKGDATVASAETEIRGIAARLAEAYPETNANLSARLVPLHERTVGPYRKPLLLLLGAVGGVLLIAATNIANLLLARGTARERELAVRTALGASRGRLVRLFLTESLVLTAIGGVVGIALAAGLLDTIVHLSPTVPRLDAVTLDGRVLLAMTGVIVLTGLGLGIMPAIYGSRTDLALALKNGARSSAARAKHRVQRGLIVGEMALSTVLVVAAALLVASFIRLVGVDPGFDSDNILTMRLNLPGRTYMQDPNDQWSGSNAFFQDLEQRVKRLPGVDAATLSYTNPLEPERAFNVWFQVPGYLERPRAERPLANLRTVTPDFFETFGIRLLRGRLFDSRDRKDTPGAAIINETMARRYFPERDPIGLTLERPDYWSGAGYPRLATIVGVVSDVKSAGLDRDPVPAMYFAFTQAPMGNMRLIARTTGRPEDVAPAIRAQVWAIDPNQPVDNLYTMDQILSASVSSPRFTTVLVGSFAALALLLAGVGVYGVTSFTVGQRFRELGVRQALGADRGNIIGMVVAQGMQTIGLGIAVGMGIALVGGRAIETFLFGVGATDPGVLIGVAAVLAVVGLLACYVPARRATWVDPVVALRIE